MMPVFPGAPWVPKFKGPDGDYMYSDWKEQVQGLLGVQDLTEPRKVQILMGALSGEAKREINVLEAGDRDTAEKIFGHLDSLYAAEIPLPVLRAQFFGCRQRSGETFKAFVLRLRELFCRLWSSTPYVIVELIGETGLVYKVRPEQGGPEKTLHRNALKFCMSKPTSSQQSQQEDGEAEADSFIPYSIWTAAPNVPDERLDNIPVRRSNRVNFGQRPVRYRENP